MHGQLFDIVHKVHIHPSAQFPLGQLSSNNAWYDGFHRAFRGLRLRSVALNHQLEWALYKAADAVVAWQCVEVYWDAYKEWNDWLKIRQENPHIRAGVIIRSPIFVHYLELVLKRQGDQRRTFAR